MKNLGRDILNYYSSFMLDWSGALPPEKIHIKGIMVQLDSPLNVEEKAVFSDSAVETWKEMYYNEK